MAYDLESLRDAFGRRGFRLTSQRRIIVRLLLETRGHYSADEVIDLLRRHRKRVSKATVYRTLSILEQCGVFASHDFGGGRKIYERATGRKHHDHLCCTHCGSVTEFEEPRIEKLQEEVARRFGFTAESHSHKVFGTCARCTRVRKGPSTSL